MNKYNNFNYELDDYEKEIEEALEKKWPKSVPNAKKEIARYRGYAKAMLDKTKNVNIRISEGDLYQIKSTAAQQGIPYQTLLSSLIHQYSRGRIDYNVLREPKKEYKGRPRNAD